MKKLGINDVLCTLPEDTEFALLQMEKAYEYEDGKRTEKVVGTRCTVLVSSCGNALLDVVCEDMDDGVALNEAVEFDGLVLRPWSSNGYVQISAKAKMVRPAE